MWKALLGFVAGVLAFGAFEMWTVIRAADNERHILFPEKTLTTWAGGFELSGSIVGDGENRPINGFVTIECRRERGWCKMHSVDQISDNHVAGIYESTLWIEEWGDTVRLSSLNPESSPADPPCNYFEIRIDLSDEAHDALYTRLPHPNADKAECAELAGETVNQTMQWRIDDGYARQALADSAK